MIANGTSHHAEESVTVEKKDNICEFAGNAPVIRVSECAKIKKKIARTRVVIAATEVCWASTAARPCVSVAIHETERYLVEQNVK